MHLINCRTMKLEFFVGDRIPPYAILSHTWDEGEVSMQGFLYNPKVKEKRGYAKIAKTCELAMATEWVHRDKTAHGPQNGQNMDGLGHAWVDTCCIDKSSSAELSKAINSMFAWYRDAKVCYAYLSDVQTLPVSVTAYDERFASTFTSSRWFTRGWTLQELIAPPLMYFYNAARRLLGRRDSRSPGLPGGTVMGDEDDRLFGTSFSGLIQRRTGINEDALGNPRLLSGFPVARRMSWAAHRQTARIKDRAYSLLGLFDLNMPLLYGEGKRAFVRLQEEIIRSTADHSILAWTLGRSTDDHKDQRRSLLADSPSCFAESGWADLYKGSESLADPFTLTNAGIQIKLPTVLDPKYTSSR